MLTMVRKYSSAWLAACACVSVKSPVLPAHCRSEVVRSKLCLRMHCKAGSLRVSVASRLMALQAIVLRQDAFMHTMTSTACLRELELGEACSFTELGVSLREGLHMQHLCSNGSSTHSLLQGRLDIIKSATEVALKAVPKRSAA